MNNVNEGTELVEAWEALDFRDPETKFLQSIIPLFSRKQYTPTPKVKGVCGYPMPNGIAVILNYKCTVCSGIRTIPVAGVIGIKHKHIPVGCLRCNGQFSTVFCGVDIEAV